MILELYCQLQVTETCGYYEIKLNKVNFLTFTDIYYFRIIMINFCH